MALWFGKCESPGFKIWRHVRYLYMICMLNSGGGVRASKPRWISTCKESMRAIAGPDAFAAFAGGFKKTQGGGSKKQRPQSVGKSLLIQQDLGSGLLIQLGQ